MSAQVADTNGKDFSFETIKDFDKHIDLSIPNYSHLSEIIESVSQYFIYRDSFVYDIGCSTGTLIKNLSLKTDDKSIKFIGIDISENLLPPSDKILNFVYQDLESLGFSLSNCSLVTSVFTLQFIHPQSRERIIETVYSSLIPGGAFIIAEKIYSESGKAQDIMNFAHYDYKSKSFTEAEILGKQKQLRRIMKPRTQEENESELLKAGFKTVELFFKTLNFCAWLCIK